MELFDANRNWSSRPDDQRFLSLSSLLESVENRRVTSWTSTPRFDQIQATLGDNGEVGFRMLDYTKNVVRELSPTNYGMGKVATFADVPASYLTKLVESQAPELAVACLNQGLISRPIRKADEHQEAMILGQDTGESIETLRSLTSPTYGRIWDAEVVRIVMDVTKDGAWQIPHASYQREDPLKATTLYGSDRDVWIFLVDEEHKIQVGDEELSRGFFAWNSEVGHLTFGLKTFLYRRVCDNRIVWGAENVQEFSLRHSKNAPQRFMEEGSKMLESYAISDATQTARMIEAAKAFEIPKASEDKGIQKWLQNKGFGVKVAQAAIDRANEEGEKAHTLWGAVQGLTAYARGIAHTDERIKLETSAGKLLDIVKGASLRTSTAVPESYQSMALVTVPRATFKPLATYDVSADENAGFEIIEA